MNVHEGANQPRIKAIRLCEAENVFLTKAAYKPDSATAVPSERMGLNLSKLL